MRAGIMLYVASRIVNNVRLAHKGLLHGLTRGITVTSLRGKKSMPPRPAAPSEDEFTEKFLCGSGPGGQKINKTSSAVQLKHIPTGIVLKVQATRSRIQNRKLARQMLADKLEQLEKGTESRAAIVGEAKRKKKSSAVKKSKRKYKALDAAKADVGNSTDEVFSRDEMNRAGGN